MDLSKASFKVNEVDKGFIPHTAIRSVLQGIELAIALSSGAQEPTNVLLTGNAGTGKTTSCKAVLNKFKTYPINVEQYQADAVPAFYSSIPSPVTVKGVASSLLNSLGDPTPTSGATYNMTKRLGTLLKNLETKVIMLDELQHLLKKDTENSNDVKNWIKQLINEFKVPLVIIGTPQCESIIDSDDQIARRFKLRYRLSNLEFGSAKKGEARKFIEALARSYEAKVGISFSMDFKSRTHSLMVYSITGGNPSNITDLFKHTAILTLLKNKSKATKEHFAEAYSTLSMPNQIKFKKNPFLLTDAQFEKAFNQHCRSIIL